MLLLFCIPIILSSYLYPNDLSPTHGIALCSLIALIHTTHSITRTLSDIADDIKEMRHTQKQTSDQLAMLRIRLPIDLRSAFQEPRPTMGIPMGTPDEVVNPNGEDGHSENLLESMLEGLVRDMNLV